MTLKETVSKIKGYEVTEGQARMFASEQYGVLASYIRGKFIDSFNKSAPKKTKPIRRNKVKERDLPKHIYRTSKTNKKPYVGAIALNGKIQRTVTYNTVEEALEGIEEIKKAFNKINRSATMNTNK